MPFYEYECQSCKFYTELMQKISDPPLEKCPSCGKKTMQKLISAPNFRLKGGGWYETVNQRGEFRSALARKVTQYIVHASTVCRHVQCWLHFLCAERLDRLLRARTLKVVTRYRDSFAD
jgi:putative FmdB family regulatory protein